MIPFPSAISGGLSHANLTWSRRGRFYELNLGNEIAGTMQQESFWCSRHEAVTAAGKWIFRRAGFLHSGAEIVDARMQQPIATLESSWCGPRTLVFHDGQTFLIKSRGFLHPVWGVTNPDGEALLQVHKRERRVELTNGARLASDRAALLILFTLYRIWIAEQDAAAAVVVAAS
jgi:hypothetical protein